MRREIIGYKCTFGKFDTYEAALAEYNKLHPKEQTGFYNLCSVIWDEPKQPEWLMILGKALFFLVFVVASGAILITVISGLPAFFAETLPAIFKSIKDLGELIYLKILAEIPILRGIINALDSVWTNYIKPSLQWVYGKVTEISDAIYTVYESSVGGLVKVYDDLFGWVDGFQAAVNGALDKTSALIGVVSQETADKIQAVKEDFNNLVDKLFVDWFDKAIKAINDVATPILTRIDEVVAVFTTTIATVTGTADRAIARLDTQELTALEHAEDRELDNAIAAQEPEEPFPAAEAVMTPPPPAEKEISTPMERALRNFVGWLFGGTDVLFTEMEKLIDEAVADIIDENWRLQHDWEQYLELIPEGSYDQDFIRWWIGEITFDELLKAHWKDVLLGPPPPKTKEEVDTLVDYRKVQWKSFAPYLTDEQVNTEGEKMRQREYKKLEQKKAKGGAPGGF